MEIIVGKTAGFCYGVERAVNGVKEEIQRAKAHQKLRCEDISLKDIDDNPNNNTHEHIEGIDEMYIRSCVKEILKNETIASVYGKDDVRKQIIEEMKNKEYISKEELVEEVSNKMEETAEKEPMMQEHEKRLG